MSNEKLIKLMEAVANDENLKQQLQNAGSFQQIKTLAGQQGYDLGDLAEVEAARTIGVVTGKITEELTDDELEMVAGWSWDESNMGAFKFDGIDGESNRVKYGDITLKKG
jgi:predicted ribosomally synthesized peptide with nif11-like leader